MSERAVRYKHVLKNGLIPVVTVLGLQLGVLARGRHHHRENFRLAGLGCFSSKMELANAIIDCAGVRCSRLAQPTSSHTLTDMLYRWLDSKNSRFVSFATESRVSERDSMRVSWACLSCDFSLCLCASGHLICHEPSLYHRTRHRDRLRLVAIFRRGLRITTWAQQPRDAVHASFRGAFGSELIQTGETFSRVVFGARISLEVGVIVVLVQHSRER